MRKCEIKITNFKKLLILMITFILISFIGCMDAIDADNPAKVPVNPKISPLKNTKIRIDNVSWMFTETFIISGGGSHRQTWWGYTKYIRNEITLDTANTLTALWIDLEAESTIPEQFYNITGERVLSFRLKADSLIINKPVFLNEAPGNNTFAELKVKKVPQSRIDIYTGQDITIGISIISNGFDDTLICSISATLFNRKTTSLVQFEGYAEIKYTTD